MKRPALALAILLVSALASAQIRHPETHECRYHDFFRGEAIGETINIFGCFNTASLLYYNPYQFYGTAGETIRFVYSAVTLPDLEIQIQAFNGSTVLAFAYGFRTATLDFPVLSSGYYVVFVSTQTKLATGDYTLLGTTAPGAGGPPPSSACQPSTTALCLNNRFKVAVQFINSAGGAPAATAVPMTTDTGYFWFFSGGNVELVIKVVDGRGFNSKFWVFAGGLTNVETTVTVQDTATGAFKTYHNPAGVAFQPIQDTAAF